MLHVPGAQGEGPEEGGWSFQPGSSGQVARGSAHGREHGPQVMVRHEGFGQ